MPIENLNGNVRVLGSVDERTSNVPNSFVRERQSDIVQEFVSNKPGFLIQFGNLFFLLALTIITAASWFIKYPEVIKANAKLTAINAPKPVVTLVDGKLIKLNIAEDDLASKGQILGWLESTANHQEVLKLAANLDSIQTLLNSGKVNQIEMYSKDTPAFLGELQAAHQVYSQSVLTFKNYLSNGFYPRKRKMLLRDQRNLLKLYTNLDEQRKLQEQDLDLIQKTFDANELLMEEEVIADFDYRSEHSKLINKKLMVPQLRSAIINNESMQAEKEKEIMELENSISQQKMIFQQALSTFKSQVDEWKKKYFLTAPISGKVAFASFMQENQQLIGDQTICFINPEDSHYFAQITIPQSNLGKAEIGQQVMLKFKSYPFQEYGPVIGKIDFISHIPTDSGYLAKVVLVNGLNTTYGKQLQFRDGLLANAEIVTKDMRLLERFYFNLVRQIKD